MSTKMYVFVDKYQWKKKAPYLERRPTPSWLWDTKCQINLSYELGVFFFITEDDQ